MDSDLIAEFVQANSPKAFEQIVARHQQMVYRVCLKILRNRTDAEDATQATFLVLAKKAKSLTNIELLSGWLYRVAVLVCKQMIRAKIRARTREEKYAMQATVESAEASALSEREGIRALDENGLLVHSTVASLSDMYRIPITAHYLEGKTAREIADALGISQTSVSTRISRGLKKIRRTLMRRGVLGVSVIVLVKYFGTTAAGAVPSTLSTSLSTLTAQSAASATAAAAAGMAIKTMLLAKAKATTGIVAAITVAAGGITYAIQGRVTGPTGEPLEGVTVQIREKREPGQMSIASADVLTDKKGYYRYPGMDSEYSTGFLNKEELPNGNGYRFQYARVAGHARGEQTADFQFTEFPFGSACVIGQAIDQYGEPIKEYRLNVRTSVEWQDRSNALHQIGYDLFVTRDDGRFQVTNLPADVFTVYIDPKESEYTSYSTEVELKDGETVDLSSNIVENPIVKRPPYYGRILLRDGSVPLLEPIPWPSACVQVGEPLADIDSMGYVSVDSQGYFVYYLSEDKHEQLVSGNVEFTVLCPIYTERNVSRYVAKFPVRLLSLEKSKAGVVKIDRPER